MTPINLSRVHFPVTTLGPGRRIGVWLQGCSIRCPGCISMDTWAEGRGATTVASVMAALRPWLGHADGITVSGGEPFDQSAALRALLTALRTETAIDVFVYSGHPFERIAQDVSAMHGLIDALMSDRFQREAPQTLALRGSDNQRLHLLTELGRKRFGDLDRTSLIRRSASTSWSMKMAPRGLRGSRDATISRACATLWQRPVITPRPRKTGVLRRLSGDAQGGIDPSLPEL